MTTQRKKTVKKYTTKNSQFCDKNYFRNVTNVSCIGENCPKYLIINKTPKSTFCHVTSHTPTQLCPCIKVLIAFESSSMRIDTQPTLIFGDREKGQKGTK